MAANETAGSPPVPASPLDKPVEEQTVAELRGTIARKAGKRTNWSTPLDKPTLNSVYAYLTGEFYTPKRALHDPDHYHFEPRAALLVGVVHEAGIGEPEDEWSFSRADQPDALRKPELRALHREMSERGDQRDWAGGGSDGE